MDPQQISAPRHWWPEFAGCGGQELPMIGIVRHEMKWYSRNNRRLWCFKAPKVEAVHVFISSGVFSRVGGTNRLHMGWLPGRAVLILGKLVGGWRTGGVPAKPVLNCSTKVR